MCKFPGLILWSVVFLLMVEGAHAATTLYLPRQFNSSDLGTIGVALVNPTTTAASVTFRWRDGQGGSLNTAQQAIPAKGQLSVTLGEVFPNVTAVGWLSADVDIDQVTGFWLVGDFVTSADGAALLSSSNAIASPVFTFFSSKSEISFANLGSGTLTGNLVLYNSSGQNLGSVPFTLPSLGCYQNTVAGLFPAQAADFDNNGYWINVSSSTSSGQVIGTAITPNSGSDNIVTNAAYESSNLFLFPQVVDGTLGGTTYNTILTLTNFQTSSQTATLTLRQPSRPTLTAQRTIPARGVLRSSVLSLFGVSSLDGWLLVGTGGGGIGGFITYTDLVSGGSTAVSMQRQASDTNLIFGHIADLNPWWTGIALVNYFTTAANVEVYAIDPAGALIGGPAQAPVAAFTLAPQTKRAFLLGDLVPRTQQRLVDGGFIHIRSTNGVGLYGTELFFLRSGRVIASVPGTGLGTTTFTPPTNLSVNAVTISVAPATATVAGEATQQFSATVTGTTNRAVTWSVNDVVGGNATVGTISTAGLYMAPSAVPSTNPVTVKATSAADSSKSATASVTVTALVTPTSSRQLIITSSAPPAASAGVNYVYAFNAAGGTPPYTWSGLVKGGGLTTILRNGMTISSTGILSGKPLYSGLMPIYVEVKDAQNRTTGVQYEFQVTGTGSAARFTNSPPNGTEGTPYNFRFAANWTTTGGFCSNIDVSFVHGTLPPSITMSIISGTLSGTPTTPGIYTFTVLAEMGFGISCPPDIGYTNTQTFTIQINPKSPTAAQRGSSNWVRASAPVLTPTPGGWDGFAVRAPSVIKVGDTYLMYYEGEDVATHTSQIGLAASTDGISWTKSIANPVLRVGDAGAWDELELKYPAVHFDGATYRMWYSGRSDRARCNRVGLATSADGVNWTKYEANPITLPDQADGTGAISRCVTGSYYDWTPGTVIQTDGIFTMFSWRPSSFIWAATSADGINWVRKGDGGTIPAGLSSSASVVLDGSTYRVWFNKASTFATGSTTVIESGLGYATSADAYRWTAAGGTVFVPGPANTWDRTGVGAPSVMLDGSTFKMWYTAGRIRYDRPEKELTFVEGSIGYATTSQ